jgi:hypothetical protein
MERIRTAIWVVAMVGVMNVVVIGAASAAPVVHDVQFSKSDALLHGGRS